MEIRVLQYFLAIAREESISGAAEYLHITQPTLSRQMKDLEDEFGKQLFIRGNRKITLTDDGMLLRKRAEEIINLVDKTQIEMNSSDNQLNGDIYIGGGETEGLHLITKIIKAMQNEHPQLKFHLYSGNAEDVSERLDKGLIDFGLVIKPANIYKYDYIDLPATDVWGVLMRKDSPLAKLDKITVNDIKNLPVICSRQALSENETKQWFGKDYDNLNIVSTYNLLYNASIMVQEGIGYAITIDKLINTSGDSPLCFRPLEPRSEVGLAFVWKKYQIFPKPAQQFLTMIQKEYNKD